MSRRITLVCLILISLTTIISAAHYSYTSWAWLKGRGLDGAAFLMMIFLTVFAIAEPLRLAASKDEINPIYMVRNYFVRLFLMLGLAALIVAFFVGIGLLIALPGKLGQPYLLLPMLLLLLPMVLSLIDMFNNKVERSLANLFWCYCLYFFQPTYLILVQLATIPIAFVIYPAGFFLQFLAIVQYIVIYADGPYSEIEPLLCDWINIFDFPCTPFLICFHLGHLALAVAGIKYGNILLDKSADVYASVLKQLQSKID